MFFKKNKPNDREVKAFLAQLDDANPVDVVGTSPVQVLNINAETEAKIALYEEVLRGTEYPEERDMIVKYIKSLKAELKG